MNTELDASSIVVVFSFYIFMSIVFPLRGSAAHQRWLLGDLIPNATQMRTRVDESSALLCKTIGRVCFARALPAYDDLLA